MTSSHPEGMPRGEAGFDRHARAAERLANLQTVVVGLALAVALLWLLSDVFLLLFAATLIACQLKGAAAYVARHTSLGYGAALALVVLVIFGGLGFAFWLRGPVIVGEVRMVAEQVRVQVAQIWQHLGDADWLQEVVDRVRAYAASLRSHAAGLAAGFVTGTLGNVGSLLLVLVAALYLAAAPQQYVDGLLSLLPPRWRRRGGDVLAHEGRTLRRWFLGQLMDMAAIGLLTGLGLMLLGVKLWPTLGLIAALCNFVPYIGALAGSVPAIVVALSQGPWMALDVAILFVAAQTLEGNVIAPMIQRRTVDLPPVVTLLSQTVLGTLFGPLGLVLATPITAAAMVLVRMIYIDTVLEQTRDAPLNDCLESS